MPALPRFSQEMHPDLWSKPLNGKGLAEFIQLLEDNNRLKSKMTNAPLLKMPGVDDMIELFSRIGQELTIRLKAAKEAEYGVDAGDLQAIIKKITGVENQNLGRDEIAERLQPELDHQNQTVVFGHDKEALIQSAYPQLLHMFSICLAKQEGMEKKLLEIARIEREEEIRQASANRFLPDNRDNKANEEMIQAATFIAMSGLQISLMTERGSPVVDLYKQIVFGPDYPQTGQKAGEQELLEHLIAINYDIDPQTHAGAVRMGEVKQKLSGTVNALLGQAIQID